MRWFDHQGREIKQNWSIGKVSHVKVGHQCVRHYYLLHRISYSNFDIAILEKVSDSMSFHSLPKLLILPEGRFDLMRMTFFENLNKNPLKGKHTYCHSVPIREALVFCSWPPLACSRFHLGTFDLFRVKVHVLSS